MRLEVLSEEQSAERLAVPLHLCVVLWWEGRTNTYGVRRSTSGSQPHITTLLCKENAETSNETLCHLQEIRMEKIKKTGGKNTVKYQ